MKAAGRKQKGTKLERDIVKLLQSHGLDARRQPLSGALQEFPHDVQVTMPSGRRLIIEAKAWKDGWRTGDKAMGQADMLVMKRNFGDPMVYLSLAVFVELLCEADPPEKNGIEPQEKPSGGKIQSRGFDKTRRRKFDGTVEDRG